MSLKNFYTSINIKAMTQPSDKSAQREQKLCIFMNPRRIIKSPLDPFVISTCRAKRSDVNSYAIKNFNDACFSPRLLFIYFRILHTDI